MTPGASVGGCRLVRELGRGGVGVVWEAVDEASGAKVALKVLLQVDERVRQRLRVEGNALAKLQHPNAAVVHRWGEDQGRPYLVMRLVEGGSLRERILKHGPLEQREAARMAEKLARALAHAHAQGVLHRDLKPGNVLVDRRGEPILCDFGLARIVTVASGLTRSGEMLGTPAYMSPEQAEGERGRVDEKSDVYGLGAILYEMLTGRPPFGGPTILNQIHAVMTATPAAPSAVRVLPLDRDLEAVCLRCLAKEPASRFPSATALADTLAEWLERTAPRPRSRPAWLLPAGVLALGALAAVGLVVARRRGEPAPATSLAPSPSTASVGPPSPVEPPAPIDTQVEIELALGRWDGQRALALLEGPDAQGTPRQRLRALDLAGKLREASGLATRVLSDPSSTEDRYAALLLLAQYEPDPQQALAFLRAAAKEQPDAPEAQARIALRYLFGGQDQVAQQILDDVLARHPDHAEALRNRAQVSWERGKARKDKALDPVLLGQAERLFERARAIEEEGEGWALLAWTYRDWKQEQVLVAYRRSWEIREVEPTCELATHFVRMAQAELERGSGPEVEARAGELVTRALGANDRHPGALELQGRLIRLGLERTPEGERTGRTVNRALGALGWAMWVNPCYDGAAREIYLVLRLAAPELPGEEMGNRAPGKVSGYLDGAARLRPSTSPDLLKAQASLRLALGASAWKKPGELVPDLRRLGSDPEAQELLARIKDP